MRKQIMDGLRKAGQRFLDFDAAYADKLGQSGSADSILSAFGMYGRAVPLKEFKNPVMPVGTYEAMGGIGPRSAANAALGNSVDKGLLLANLASRYALPAGSITLAGKGLYDLSQGLYAIAADTPVFGGPEDGSQPGQLPLS